MIVTQLDEQAQARAQIILQAIPEGGQDTAEWLIDHHFAQQAEINALHIALAERDEIIADQGQEIADLRGQLADQQEMHRRRDEQQTRTSGLLTWIQNMLANKSIPSGCKVTYMYLYLFFALMRDKIVGDEMHLPLIQIEAGTGQSTSVIKTHLSRAADHDLLARRDEDTTNKDGEKRTIVHLTLHDAILDSEHINLEKKQGGKRKKGCSVDGEPLNNYTVRHCPTHHTIKYYGQPGNPKGIDDDIMVKDFIKQYQYLIPAALQEVNTCTHSAKKSPSPDSMEAQSSVLSATPSVGPMTPPLAHSPLMEKGIKPLVQGSSHNQITLEPTGEKFHANDTQTISISDQKQVAFAPGAQIQSDQALPISDPVATTCTKKQVAFAPGAQLDAQQVPVKSASSWFDHSTMERRVKSCGALIQINKHGEQAHALDKVVSSKPCGSTRWQWSDVDGCRICAECWTPLG